MEQKKIQISANIISALFGSFDSNIKKIENEYSVTIINRGDDIDVIGESKDIEKAINVINSLDYFTKKDYISENIKDIDANIKLKEFIFILVLILLLIFLIKKYLDITFLI